MNYLELINFFIFIFLFSFSMFGWGNIFFSKPISNLISINIVIGMGFTLFLGGILNFLSLANENSIRAIFFIGLLLFIIKIIKIRYSINKLIVNQNFRKINLIFILPIILLMVSVFSSLNPDTYNIFDDFQKYFLHPVKMLETGSIFGSNLSALGRETFGGQAFFQSFYVTWLGLRGLNIFDSIFCLCIIIFIILEWSIKQKITFIGFLTSSLIIVIQPQYVNISSLYSGALFMISSILIALELFKNNLSYNLRNLKVSLGISLCFSSLIVLKPIYILFPLIFFSLLIFFYFFFYKLNKEFIFLILIIPILTIILCLPWTIFSLKNYFNFQSNIGSIDLQLNMLQSYVPSIISIKALKFGATQFHYSLLIFLGSFLVLLNIFLLKNKKIELNEHSTRIFIVSSSSLLAIFVIYLILLMLAGINYIQFGTSIRYSIPFVIATFPLGFLILSSLYKNHLQYLKVFISLIILTSLVSFFPHYVKRTNQYYKCGSQLSFSSAACSKQYLDYNKFVFTTNKKDSVRKLQEYIPEGETIMAWINTPFYLNFKRNKIIEMDVVGINNPWATFPSSKYMIWEYKGLATRSFKYLNRQANNETFYDRMSAIRTLILIRKIQEMLKIGKIDIIKNDGSTIIFEIN
jgi:hypothetical protein